MKHFKLRKDLSREFLGRILYRIEATTDSKYAKKGDLGGYVESESNLSDNAWVYDNAQVFGDALISDNAHVYDNAQVFGNAHVYGSAKVSDYAQVSGYAQVFCDALISNNAQVYGNARVYDNARVYGNALISVDAHVYDNARVEKTPITITGLKHNITLTETHIFIGCEGHTIKHWKKEIKNIGKKHRYTDKEIKGTIAILKGALMRRGD